MIKLKHRDAYRLIIEVTVLFIPPGFEIALVFQELEVSIVLVFPLVFRYAHPGNIPVEFIGTQEAVPLFAVAIYFHFQLRFLDRVLFEQPDDYSEVGFVVAVGIALA
jgi:hypothetical protein